MIEKASKNVGLASAYTADIRQQDKGGVLRIRLLGDGALLTWSDIIDRWQHDQAFRCSFISILADAPFRAFFWETPPVTSATVDRAFEFVLVDSQQLAGIRTDERAFTNQFALAEPSATVVEFSNLGGDARLVVPCPSEPLSAYSQISKFARGAPDDQQHQLWIMVGAALERRLGAKPVWLSTSGLGIYWLHIRLDNAPKYYSYEPYRRS